MVQTNYGRAAVRGTEWLFGPIADNTSGAIFMLVAGLTRRSARTPCDGGSRPCNGRSVLPPSTHPAALPSPPPSLTTPPFFLGAQIVMLQEVRRKQRAFGERALGPVVRDMFPPLPAATPGLHETHSGYLGPTTAQPKKRGRPPRGTSHNRSSLFGWTM